MTGFEIRVEPTDDAGGSAGWDEPHQVSVHAGGTNFFRLFRAGEERERAWLEAPPAPLAFWIVDNWWRIRWEPMAVEGPAAPNWFLAHELSAIGGGYVWPRLRIWGDGARITLSSRASDTSASVPMTYLTREEVVISADAFEREVDRFLDRAVEAESGDRDALKSVRASLDAERRDEEAAAWRRLEARMGFDPGDAPDALFEELKELMDEYDPDGVEEAAAAVHGEASARTLEREIAAADNSPCRCDLRNAVSEAGEIDKGPDTLPWKSAKEAAERIRESRNDPAGPLPDEGLSELLELSRDAVSGDADGSSANLNYGLRLERGESGRNVVALRKRQGQARRFELCRVLGDAIWSGNDASAPKGDADSERRKLVLGPLTDTDTERQKFQRAFARHLLCPSAGLKEYFNGEADLGEKILLDDVLEAARHFNVAEHVIGWALVQDRLVDRERLGELYRMAA